MLTMTKNGQVIELAASDIDDVLSAIQYACSDDRDERARVFGCVMVKASSTGAPDAMTHQMTDKKRLTDC